MQKLLLSLTRQAVEDARSWHARPVPTPWPRRVPQLPCRRKTPTAESKHSCSPPPAPLGQEGAQMAGEKPEMARVFLVLAVLGISLRPWLPSPGGHASLLQAGLGAQPFVIANREAPVGPASMRRDARGAQGDCWPPSGQILAGASPGMERAGCGHGGNRTGAWGVTTPDAFLGALGPGH